MKLQEAWDIIEVCLYPDRSRCVNCAEGGCDWPDCECHCHDREDEARAHLSQATSEVKRDSERLDFLERQNGQARYTGRCIFRQSRHGRGWRLHETSSQEAVGSVRRAIDEAMVTEED